MENHILEKLGRDVSVFTRMFDLIKDLVCLIEVDNNYFRYIYLNQSALRILNIKRDIIGCRIEDILSPEQSKVVIQKYKWVQSNQKPIEFIDELTTVKGVFIGETSLIPLLENGECRFILAIVRDITEKKQKERELKESKKRLQSLVEHNADAVFEFDIEGKIISVNKRATELTNFKKEEFIGQSFKHFIVYECLDETTLFFEKALDGSNEKYETTIYNKNGDKVHLRVKNIPILIDGNLVGVYGIAKDITAEKQMKEEIHKKNKKLEVFWNKLQNPIALFDRKGQIERFNPAFAQLFEFQKGDISRLSELIPLEVVEERREIIQRMAKGETIKSLQSKKLTKSGKVIDLLVSLSPLRDKNGQFVGAYAFYKDVTKLLKAERGLRKSQKKYQMIAENAFDVIKLINPSGIIEYVSPSNMKILDYTSSEYVGKSFLTYVHPDDVPLIEDRFNLLIKEHKPFTSELRVRHKDGHYIWMEVNVTPVIEEGEVQELVSIARDITERIKLRDELVKAASHDYLSGLPNRRVFNNRLQMAIQQADYSGKKVAVMMLDGRNFKHINDTYGHDAGDAVIVEMGKRLELCVRDTDTVVRFGGDEMAIILPGIESPQVAEDIAKRIIISFNAPFYYSNKKIQMGVGIGIALYPDQTLDKKLLVKYADKALYKAKESGRNDFRIYTE